jgi:hypothetical protein
VVDEQRKIAYRYLLYWAMLDIRKIKGVRLGFVFTGCAPYLVFATAWRPSMKPKT